jgi:hypothetical protein
MATFEFIGGARGVGAQKFIIHQRDNSIAGQRSAFAGRPAIFYSNRVFVRSIVVLKKNHVARDRKFPREQRFSSSIVHP